MSWLIFKIHRFLFEYINFLLVTPPHTHTHTHTLFLSFDLKLSGTGNCAAGTIRKNLIWKSSSPGQSTGEKGSGKPEWVSSVPEVVFFFSSSPSLVPRPPTVHLHYCHNGGDSIYIKTGRG